MSPLFTPIGYMPGQAAPGTDVGFDQVPRHHGWTAWTCDPRNATSFSGLNSTNLNLSKIMVPETITPTSVWIWLNVNGVTLANCYIGIYSSAGVLLGTGTADQSASWVAGAPVLKQITIAPGTIVGGVDVFVWVAFLVGSSGTPPQFMRRVPGAGVIAVNLNLTAANSSGAIIANGNTTLAASFTPSSLTPAGIEFWAALS